MRIKRLLSSLPGDQASLPQKYMPRTAAEIIGESELLDRLPISRRTLHSWRKAGKLPFIRVPGSRKLLYSWQHVVATLERMEVGV